ncbi:hypothetical protein [Parvicella tangerina]|uniref:Uncharacterized protein n=1 Tax=Parvicella tangerina TaxID=2829795 RepID=A0A916JQJ4_9FLAO|nr:hypothetical protein [Parvicella tangerina]CAG5086026.1 hypothetical protein CRYO30217_02981 [Parvicella tangerina]
MSKELFAVIISLVGIAFGWFLNSMGKWFNRRKESQQIKNHALFTLLEINYNFMLLNDDSRIELALTKMEKFVPEAEREEMREFMKPFYSQILNKSISEQVKADLEKVEETYSNAVQELSKIDPVRAYRLHGKSNIFRAFDAIDSYFESIEVEFPMNEEDLEELDNVQDSVTELVEPEILKAAIDDLQDEIKGLSKSIGYRTWLKCKKAIDNIDFSISPTEMKTIDTLLETLIPQVRDSLDS